MYKIIKVNFRRGDRFSLFGHQISKLYLYEDGDYELIGTDGYVIKRGKQTTKLPSLRREQDKHE